MLPVETAFKIYTGLDGKPLDGGYVYFGEPNQNPITAPVTVYWDAAGTQPVAEPLRTENGYIVRNGTPANVFYSAAYSQLVQDSRRRQVYYSRTSDDYSIATVVQNFITTLASSAGAALIGFIQAGAGAVLRTMQDKNREIVSLTDYYQNADGTDWLPAWNRALAAVSVGGAVVVPAGAAREISGPIIIPKDNITICGLLGAPTFIAESGVNFEYMMLATSRSNVTVRNIIFDANKAGRSGTQNIRFMGLGFVDCTDCLADNVTAQNTRGYNSIPAVGVAIGGASVRCRIINSFALNCGDNTGTTGSDGFFTSGTANMVLGCQAVNCTDTGAVIESSNRSKIKGFIASGCNCVAAITNATNTDKFDNTMEDITGYDWNSSVTGGIQIGNPVAGTTGNLYDTSIRGLNLRRVAGIGPAINVRKTGTAQTIGLKINDATIRGASTQGMLINAVNVDIDNADISGTTNANIQVQTGSSNVRVTNSRGFGGSFGVVSTDVQGMRVQDYTYDGQGVGAYAVYFFGTATDCKAWDIEATAYLTGIVGSDVTTVPMVMNKASTGIAFRKDAGVNIYPAASGDLLRSDGRIVAGNGLGCGNSVGASAVNTVQRAAVLYDTAGNPLGYVPIYQTFTP